MRIKTKDVKRFMLLIDLAAEKLQEENLLMSEHYACKEARELIKINERIKSSCSYLSQALYKIYKLNKGKKYVTL